jgi:hypothetical protein
MFFHPFEENLTQFKDQEIENKLVELNKKYYTAARLGKPELLTQIAAFVTIYKDELNKRYLAKMRGQMDGDLDQLINVD